MEMVLGVWLCCGQEGSEVFDRSVDLHWLWRQERRLLKEVKMTDSSRSRSHSRSRSRTRSRSRSRSPTRGRRIRTERPSYREAPYRRNDHRDYRYCFLQDFSAAILDKFLVLLKVEGKKGTFFLCT
jgi:hypothetical protein